MKRKILTLLMLLLYGCDPHTDNYFNLLLNQEKANVSRICYDNDLSVMGQGTSVEKYTFSENTFKKFELDLRKPANRIPISNKYSQRYDSILVWSKTPIVAKDRQLIKIPKYMAKYARCFSLSEIDGLLRSPGNYYSAYYYNGFEEFSLFIINGKTHELILLQNSQ